MADELCFEAVVPSSVLDGPGQHLLCFTGDAQTGHVTPPELLSRAPVILHLPLVRINLPSSSSFTASPQAQIGCCPLLGWPHASVPCSQLAGCHSLPGAELAGGLLESQVWAPSAGILATCRDLLYLPTPPTTCMRHLTHFPAWMLLEKQL